MVNFDLYEKYDLNSVKTLEILIKSDSDYLIYIKKKQYKLFVINKEREIEKVFSMAVGNKKQFLTKTHSGDKGTPEGLYYVIEILSKDAEKETESFRKLKRMNYVYFTATNGYHLWGHPDKDAGKGVYGPRFFRLDYPNKEDNKNYAALKRKGLIPKNKEGKYVDQGTGIGIHGTNDPVSIGHRISSGCIRMLNEDVELLDKYIKIGTPVYIEK
ncbi:MAG: L,D-transpeptidase [Spirochaetes bacterium]|nr:L,D-transpeptidase [Spirochaetota bacterium]